MGYEVIPNKAAKFEMPKTKAEALRVLVEFGHLGFTVSNIDADRIYVLTPERPYAQGVMRRCARTLVLSEEGDDIRAQMLDGWIVG